MTDQQRRRRKGDGTRLKDGRWMIRAAIAGQRRAFIGRTQAEAKRKLDSARLATAGRKNGRLTVAEWLTAYTAERKLDLKAQSWRKMEQTFRLHVMPHIGSLRLTDVSERTLTDLYGRLTDLAPRSRHHVHAILGTALEAAYRRGLISSNPKRTVRAPRAATVHRAIWTHDQTERFIMEARDDPYWAFFAISLTTGMRPGEVMALHWQDVDLDAGLIHVRWNAIRGYDGRELAEPKTERARRTIAVPQLTIDALRQRGIRSDGLIFAGERGRLIGANTVARNHFYPLSEKAGLPRIPLYALRDINATELLEHGVAIDVVSERLGHANIATTLSHYAHVTQKRQDQAVRALEAIF